MHATSTSSSPSNAPLLRLAGIAKRYGAVEALRGVDLDVGEGEVLAICGDNGAGKSSLIRVVSGAHEPDDGAIEIDGRAVAFGSPQEALAAGVATIYQDLALAPRQPIWQNIFIGAELTRTLLPGLACSTRRGCAPSRAATWRGSTSRSTTPSARWTRCPAVSGRRWRSPARCAGMRGS